MEDWSMYVESELKTTRRESLTGDLSLNEEIQVSNHINPRRFSENIDMIARTGLLEV